VPELSYCAQQIRRFDRDRFLCTLFAPPPEREALSALYAFNLEVARVREGVREPMLGRIRLQWWRERVAGIYAGVVPREPAAAGLAEAVRRFDLSRGHFDRLVDGREFDCEDRPPPTLADLVAYAAATSSPLIALAAEICGARDTGISHAAEELGVAWALTGLIRAVPFHARTRRVYLPAGLCRSFGLDVLALFEKGPGPGLAPVVSALTDCARQHLNQSRLARASVPPAALPAFLPGALAELYLRRIAAAGHNPFDSRVQAPGLARIRALLLSRLRGRY
jgi:NADH dehydrogenase [ubiquinone] 1 alpha subcomplex assembly factor 6